MKLNEALDHFKTLAGRSNIKKEQKVYDKFVGIFSDLNNRASTGEHVLSIEEKIDELHIGVESDTTLRGLKRKLSAFTKFLQEKLSLVTDGYYTALGITFGVALGVAFAPMVERQIGISINMGLGMLIGVVIGRYLDTKAAKENRVLRTT